MSVVSVSMVMACYAGDRIDALQSAVKSVLQQTVGIFEFIIVVDGPVVEDIENYLNGLEEKNLQIKVIRLQDNCGAAKARNIGMSVSTGDYIAIMDSDDILYPQRIEYQLSALNRENVDAVWGWQEEFYDRSQKFAGIKKCPEKHEDIINSLKWRNLLPDPLTFIKRCCFDKVGGYPEVGELGIDYKFFINMAMHGCRFYCIQQPLIKVRISSEQRRRRGGLKLLKQDVLLRIWMWKKKQLNIIEFVGVMFITVVFRLQPNCMRDIVYRYILRKEI